MPRRVGRGKLLITDRLILDPDDPDIPGLLAEAEAIGSLKPKLVYKLEKLTRDDGTHTVMLGDRELHVRFATPGLEPALFHDVAIRQQLPPDIPHQRALVGTTSSGGIVVVQEDVPGITSSKALSEAESSQQADAVLSSAVQILKQIHALPRIAEWRNAPRWWGTDIFKGFNAVQMQRDLDLLRKHRIVEDHHVEFVPRRVAYLAGQSGLENYGVRDPLIKPISQRLVCLHGDPNTDNLVWDPETSSTKVLDFERATVGKSIYDRSQLLRTALRFTGLLGAENETGEALRFLMDPPIASALAMEAIQMQRLIAYAADFCREHPEYRPEALKDHLGGIADGIDEAYSGAMGFRDMAIALLTKDGSKPPQVLLHTPRESEEEPFFRACLEMTGRRGPLLDG